jgi:hypothetical protein
MSLVTILEILDIRFSTNNICGVGKISTMLAVGLKKITDLATLIWIPGLAPFLNFPIMIEK